MSAVGGRVVCLSLGCGDWSERKDSGSLVGERGKEGKAIRRPEQTRGVCSDPSHTDVHAAEAARKQASALLLPHLFFFPFVFFHPFSF